MTRAGIGYIFSEGDRIRIYPTTVDGVSNGVSTVFDVPITGFDGNLIKVANIDIGTLNSSNQAKTTFEIYRPILTKNDVLYYEIGQSYPITVQPNGDLDFSSHSASLPEDCAIVSRSNYALSGADYRAVGDRFRQAIHRDIYRSGTKKQLLQILFHDHKRNECKWAL